MIKKFSPVFSFGLFILLVYIILQRFVLDIPLAVAIPVIAVGVVLVAVGAVLTKRAPPPAPPPEDGPQGLV